MKAGAALAAIATVSLAASASASADVRYASPGGSGVACSTNAPCDLQVAVESAVGGDEVVVLPGSYGETDQLDVSASILVHGQAGAPSPLVVSSAPTGVSVTGAGALVRRLHIVHVGIGDALFLDAGIAEQVVAQTGSSQFACQVRGATLRDSICWSTGTAGSAAGMTVGSAFEQSVLRNVTAIGEGAGARGIEAEASGGGLADLRAVNVIAKGAGVDVEATSNAGSGANVDLDHSNFATLSLVGANSFATAPGTAYNQTDPPLFVNAAAGDFHEGPESPTIERGGYWSGVGSEDVDGEPRVQGYGVDIGADEYVVGPPPPDVNPPETKILKGPEKRSKHHLAKFKFGTSEPAGAILMCSVDDVPYKPCESPKGYRVGIGKHVFRVFSIDASGNVDPTPDSRTWRVKRKHK